MNLSFEGVILLSKFLFCRESMASLTLPLHIWKWHINTCQLIVYEGEFSNLLCFVLEESLNWNGGPCNVII